MGARMDQCAQRLAVVAIAAMAALATAGAAVAPAAHRSRCLPPGAVTLARSASVRVFAIEPPSRSKLPVGPIPLGGRKLYGCLFDRGKPIYLAGGHSQFTTIGAVAVAGTRVAFASRFMGIDFSSSSVITRELRSGRGSSFAAWNFSEPGRPESFYTVTDLLVSGGGAVAWITQRSGISGPVRYEVQAARAGAPALLDVGGAIAAKSLRLSGSTVAWLDGGSGRSAALP